MLSNWPRYRLLVADHGREVVVVLLLVSLLGFAGVGWLATHPRTSTVTETVYSDTVTTSTSESVVLTSDTVLYQAGQRLRNMPVYLRTWNDEFRLTIRTTLPQARAAELNHTLSVTYKAAANGGTLYSETRRLATMTTRTTDGTAVSTITLNVSELPDPKQRIAREFGSVGSISMTIQVKTAYTTDLYEGSMKGRLPLSISDDSYTVGSFSKSRTHSDSRVRTVTRGYSSVTYILTGGVGLSALAAAVLVGWYYYHELDEGRAVDRNALRDAIHRRRHAEWISEGRLSIHREADITVSSLEDLVDVAIDADRRVIHDTATDSYVVVDDEMIYRYD